MEPRTNFKKHHSIQSFIKNSKFAMTLVSVVASFSSHSSAERIMQIYQNLAEFNKYDCDVLFLAKENLGSG